MNHSSSHRSILNYRSILCLLLWVQAAPLTIAQSQYIEAALESNRIRILESTELQSAAIWHDEICLRDTAALPDTVGYVLRFANQPSTSMSLAFGLWVGTDSFLYQISNLHVGDGQGGQLTTSPISISDSLTIARLPDEIVLLHNEDLLHRVPYSATSHAIDGKILVSAGAGAQVLFMLKPQQLMLPPPDTLLIEFVDTLLVIREGDVANPCITKMGGSRSATFSLPMQAPQIPHFASYATVQISDTASLICTTISSEVPNGIKDNNHDYYVDLLPISANTIIGSKNRLRIVAMDDVVDSVTALCPGDILITAVDNNVNQDDQITLTNLKPIQPNTSFSLATAVHQQSGTGQGRWFASDAAKSPNVTSQRITYGGSNALPIGSKICIDLPSSGTGSALLATNFRVDGITTSDFSVTNNGIASDANINLDTDHPEAIFVLQGSWQANPEYADFYGAVLHGLQVGSEWLDGLHENPPFISDLPEAIDCFTPTFDAGLDIAAYYDCDNGLSATSTLTIQAEIVKSENWVFEAATSALDLPIEVCDDPCAIEELDTVWYIQVEDLIIPCEQAGAATDLINTWLASHGNGAAFSSCGIESITHDYTSLNPACGITASTEVTFIATDSCGRSFSDTGQVFIQDIFPPIWVIPPQDLGLLCSDTLLVDGLIQSWLADLGGGFAEDACDTVAVTNDYQGLDMYCDSNILVTFTAIDDCGNVEYASASIQVIDTISPSITDFAEDLFLTCDGGYNIGDTIDVWLGQHAYAMAVDNCSELVWSNDLSTVFDTSTYDCLSDTSFFVRFTAEDACGNAVADSACVHILTVEPPCDSNLVLVQNQYWLEADRPDCFGYATFQWYYRAPGDSTYSIVSEADQAVYDHPYLPGYYKVESLCHGSCLLSEEMYWPVCDSLNLVVEDSAIGLKWGELMYGNQPVSNYLISWVDQTGSEVFRSAAGSYYDDTLHLPHPLPVFQPVLPGQYIPVILQSDYGSDIRCFDTLQVDPLVCGGDYTFSYDGVGGILAQHQTLFEISDSVTLKFWFETAHSNPDKLVVVYKGDTLLNTGLVQWNTPRFRLVQVPYALGHNSVEITLENEGIPSLNTKYQMKVKCCGPELTCQDIPIAPLQLQSVQTHPQGHCYTLHPIDTTWNTDYFWDNYCIELDGIDAPTSMYSYINRELCGFSYLSIKSGCQSSQSAVEINNLASEGYTHGSGFVIDFPTDLQTRYDDIKGWILSNQDTINREIYIRFLINNCDEDLTGDRRLSFSPYAGISTFDDGQQKITFVYKDSNPFDSTGVVCEDVFSSEYLSQYSAYTYNSNHFLFSANYESIDYCYLRSRRITSQSGGGTFRSKYFRSPSCSLELKYSFTSYDYDCPCDTWRFAQDLDGDNDYETTIDSAGSATCTAPDAGQMPREAILTGNFQQPYYRLYPNPNKGLLTVDFTSRHEEPVAIDVLDINGKLIRSTKYYAVPGLNSTQLDLQRLTGGMYVIRLRGHSQQWSDRFIVMN